MNRRKFVYGAVGIGFGAVVGLSAGKGHAALIPKLDPRLLKRPPKPPPTPALTWPPRDFEVVNTPYLVIPKLPGYDPNDPIWNNWLGEAWENFDHPYDLWFMPPSRIGDSVPVCVPVANLGNMASHHAIVEIYEGPRTVPTTTLADCSLRDRIGPFVLHPGRIKGVRGTFTKQLADGSGVAIVYDPFFDPRSSIGTVGRYSPDRKNLGNCPGLMSVNY